LPFRREINSYSYGPRLREDGFYGRVVSRLTMQALNGDDIIVFGDGSQTRSFCYVADSVTGILLFSGKNRPSGQVLNIGNDEEKRILHPADTVKKPTGSLSAIRFLPFPKGGPQTTLAGHEEVYQ
jgi:UDP-glucuronate decarboxylase